jgi:hypothetical protein
VTIDESADQTVVVRRLDGQRRQVLAQLDGLSDEQLRRPVLPSGWSCLGLVRHLTLSDERYWFAVVMAGEPLDFWPEGENGDWKVGPDEAAADVIDAYRAAIVHSNDVISTRRMGDPPVQPEPWWPEAGLDFPDLRTVLVHVLVETSVHAGHLDAVRELIDGHQHLVI